MLSGFKVTNEIVEKLILEGSVFLRGFFAIIFLMISD